MKPDDTLTKALRLASRTRSVRRTGGFVQVGFLPSGTRTPVSREFECVRHFNGLATRTTKWRHGSTT